MSKIVTITSMNHKYANTYGGGVYISDFNTSYEGSHNIADRIVSDWRFDEQCKRNYEISKRMKKDSNLEYKKNDEI